MQVEVRKVYPKGESPAESHYLSCWGAFVHVFCGESPTNRARSDPVSQELETAMMVTSKGLNPEDALSIDTAFIEGPLDKHTAGQDAECAHRGGQAHHGERPS